MNDYEAAVALILELDINRLTRERHRDTNADHMALNEASERYERARAPKPRRVS